jgi:hypothetical protein
MNSPLTVTVTVSRVKSQPNRIRSTLLEHVNRFPTIITWEFSSANIALQATRLFYFYFIWPNRVRIFHRTFSDISNLAQC